LAAASHVINAALDPNLAYDPVKDFSAVAHIGSGPMLVLVNADLPVKTVGELIAHAKANPHRLNYASAGVGSATHLAMAYFASAAGLDVVHLPYKSSAEALTHLMSGEAQAMIVPTLGSQAYVSNAAIRVVAVTAPERLPALKDIPTVRESGLPDYEFVSWFGLLGPAGIPPAVVGKINDALDKAMANPAVAAAIAQIGIEPKALPPADFTRVVEDDFTLVKHIVKTAGIVSNP
jgi:tripartite-type tricarboxylate transporter receptor subunit TctC